MTTPSADQAVTPAPLRSAFVTVVAWIFIVMAGFATLISAMQALVFAFLFPGDLVSSPEGVKGLEEMPALGRFLLQHMVWLFALFWTLSIATLVCAIGLLRRKNWARMAFIAIMALGIVWNLGGILLQEYMMSSFHMPTDQDPHAAEFQVVMTVMRFVAAGFSIGIAALFAWIIKRLVALPVKAEFNAPN